MDSVGETTHILSLKGLSHNEVLERRKNGQGNDTKLASSRSYAEIVRQNVFNLINMTLFILGAVMISVGRLSDALVSVGLILLNVVIGIYQEIRAKRQLDEIALLARPKITVLRDGGEVIVDPLELVMGDMIIVHPGDQIVVDGIIADEGKIEVDESLLTGEADLIPKTRGAEVLSGSFCVTGTAIYEATRVGAESYANKLTADARQFRVVKTPLQREVDLVIRLLALIAVLFGFLLLLAASVYVIFDDQIPFVRIVQMETVIAGIIPNGLFFMVIVAYAMGALRIANKGALIQQANSVESLSNVTVLCMDKTGTLTANKINYNDVFPVGIEADELKRLLGNFANSASANNKTGNAIVEGLGGDAYPFIDEVPFSSDRKWSAIAFDTDEMRGVFVLGALEMLQPYFEQNDALLERAKKWSDAGLRVLVFAHNTEAVLLHDSLGLPKLPELTPLGLISFSDELRPHLKQTLEGFINAGIELKVISGDNPHTVASLAKQAGLPGDITAVSGTELAGMDEAHFRQTAKEATVFGRITPEQKEALVDALRDQGHYVAMMGDGVNDVLSLKKANLGIAMQSGSTATRGVADMILMNDSFGALPPAFTEGQRIFNGMQDILRLFLTRAIYSALLILATFMIGIGFPYLPKHVALLTFFTVGIPTFFLAVWARPGKKQDTSAIRAVMNFVFPASVTIALFGLLVYLAVFALVITAGSEPDVMNTITQTDFQDFQEFAGIDYTIDDEQELVAEIAQISAQSSLTIFTLLAGLMLIIFAEPPSQFWVAGDEYSGDKRPTILALLLFVAFIIILILPEARNWFEIALFDSFAIYAILGGLVIIWTFLLRLIWRRRWFERFLQLEIQAK